jgi:hypothetical protein
VPLFIAGLFRDRGQAERVITSLLDSGVPSSEISLVVREEAEEDISQREGMTGDVEEFEKLAIHSAWERLGWAGGARPAYRDKFAPKIDMAFLAAGPIAIAIGGAQLGACAGGLVGSMTNFGYTHETAREWYSKITAGKAWVMVRSSESQKSVVEPVFEKYASDQRARSIRNW